MPCTMHHGLTVSLLLERDVAERSILIKNMLEDLGESDEAIPIPNVRLSYPLSTVAVILISMV